MNFVFNCLDNFRDWATENSILDNRKFQLALAAIVYVGITIFALV